MYNFQMNEMDDAVRLELGLTLITISSLPQYMKKMDSDARGNAID
jgi:hypothetical protein